MKNHIHVSIVILKQPIPVLYENMNHDIPRYVFHTNSYNEYQLIIIICLCLGCRKKVLHTNVQIVIIHQFNRQALKPIYENIIRKVIILWCVINVHLFQLIQTYCSGINRIISLVLLIIMKVYHLSNLN